MIMLTWNYLEPDFSFYCFLFKVSGYWANLGKYRLHCFAKFPPQSQSGWYTWENANWSALLCSNRLALRMLLGVQQGMVPMLYLKHISLFLNKPFALRVSLLWILGVFCVGIAAPNAFKWMWLVYHLLLGKPRAESNRWWVTSVLHSDWMLLALLSKIPSK